MDSEVIGLFIDEVNEMLVSWEEICLKMDQSLDTSYLDELFRYAHNIKGSSGMFNLTDLSGFVHKVEDVINLARSGDVKFSHDMVEFFLSAQSFLVHWIEELKDNSDYTPDHSEINKVISSFINIDESSKNHDCETMSSVVYNISENLVISKMHTVIDKYIFIENEKYIININGDSIDTSGIQWLLCLKQDNSFSVECMCNNEIIVSGMKDLGVLEKII